MRDHLQKQLSDVETQLANIEHELQRVEKGLKKLEAPTPEETAQAQAMLQQRVYQQFDDTMQAMRTAMGSDNWMQGAKQHENDYKEWVK